MSVSYEITYQLPNGHWYTKNCENGGEYIRKLLKRGINEFIVHVWSRARTIEMHRSLKNGEYEQSVYRSYNHYHTTRGYVWDLRINGCNIITVDTECLIKTC